MLSTLESIERRHDRTVGLLKEINELRPPSRLYTPGNFIYEIYLGSEFEANKEPLRVILTHLDIDNFKREADESSKIVNANLLRPDALVVLVRRKDETPRQYCGYATACKYAIPLGQATLNTGYLSDRGIDPDVRAQHVGQFLFQLFKNIYHTSKDPLDAIFHRSGNPAAIYSAITAEVFPHYRPFGNGEIKAPFPYDENPVVRDLAHQVYLEIKRYSYDYDPNTGLCRGEYRQPGHSYKSVYEPREDHAPTMNILYIMEKVFKAKIFEGDAFLCGGEARGMPVILSEKPEVFRDNPEYMEFYKFLRRIRA